MTINIDQFTDIYRLSEYFIIPQLTAELDKISEEKHFKDLNFTIQTFQNFSKTGQSQETTFMSKIEKYLSSRIKECIENRIFHELQFSIIYRILEKRAKENINNDKLIEIILERIERKFTLLIFVELHKMSDEKVDELIENIETKGEIFKKYFEYLLIDFIFIEEKRNR